MEADVEISSVGLCEGVREADVSRMNSSGSEGEGEGGWIEWGSCGGW